MKEIYFVFCLYNECYPQQALFVPIDKQNNEIKSKIEKLKKYEPYIKETVKWDDNTGISKKYEINNKKYRVSEVCDIINDLSICLEINNNHKFTDTFQYYVNDENKYLSPKELYNELKNMTKIGDKVITIDHILMKGDIDFNKQINISIKFYIFSDKLFSLCKIKETM